MSSKLLGSISCKCTNLDKFICKCKVEPVELSTLQESDLNEIIKNVRTALELACKLITEKSKECSEYLQNLYFKQKHLILSSGDLSYDCQFDIIQNLESITRTKIQEYSEEFKRINKTKRKICSFLSFLLKKQTSSSRSLQLLGKFYNPAKVLPILIRGKKSQIDGFDQNDSNPRNTSNFSYERQFSQLSLSRGFGSVEVQRADGEFLKRFTADAKVEKKQLFRFAPPNKILVYNIESDSIFENEIITNLGFSEWINYYNIADTYLICFYNQSSSPNQSKKGFIVNLIDKSATSLKDSYFSKNSTSFPIIFYDSFYFFGGLSDEGIKSIECEAYDIFGTGWKIISQIDTPALFVSGVTIDDSIYLASNDFNSIKRYSPREDRYYQYYPHTKHALANSYVFLIKMREQLYMFYQKGIFMISNPADHVYFGAYGTFANMENMVQYQVRGDSAYILMSSRRIIKFTPVLKRPNCAEGIKLLGIS